MFVVLVGLIFVGLSAILNKESGCASSSASNPLIGDLIIVLAQVDPCTLFPHAK